MLAILQNFAYNGQLPPISDLTESLRIHNLFDSWVVNGQVIPSNCTTLDCEVLLIFNYSENNLEFFKELHDRGVTIINKLPCETYNLLKPIKVFVPINA